MGNARDISGALRLIYQHTPHVVILDIHLEDEMPKANGLDLLVTIRERYPCMKVIMLTNLAEPAYRNMCITFGASYFFDKSADFDKVPTAIDELFKSGLGQSVHNEAASK